MRSFEELNIAYDSMVQFPFLISGTGGFDTDFIKAFNGKAVTKIGGEAIRGVSVRVPNKGCVGVALKVLDGNFRALSPASIKVLDHLGFLSESEILFFVLIQFCGLMMVPFNSTTTNWG